MTNITTNHTGGITLTSPAYTGVVSIVAGVTVSYDSGYAIYGTSSP